MFCWMRQALLSSGNLYFACRKVSIQTLEKECILKGLLWTHVYQRQDKQPDLAVVGHVPYACSKNNLCKHAGVVSMHRELSLTCRHFLS